MKYSIQPILWFTEKLKKNICEVYKKAVKMLGSVKTNLGCRYRKWKRIIKVKIQQKQLNFNDAEMLEKREKPRDGFNGSENIFT